MSDYRVSTWAVTAETNPHQEGLPWDRNQRLQVHDPLRRQILLLALWYVSSDEAVAVGRQCPYIYATRSHRR